MPPKRGRSLFSCYFVLECRKVAVHSTGRLSAAGSSAARCGIPRKRRDGNESTSNSAYCLAAFPGADHLPGHQSILRNCHNKPSTLPPPFGTYHGVRLYSPSLSQPVYPRPQRGVLYRYGALYARPFRSVRTDRYHSGDRVPCRAGLPCSSGRAPSLPD